MENINQGLVVAVQETGFLSREFSLCSEEGSI